MKKYQVIGGRHSNAYYLQYVGESDSLAGAMRIAKKYARYSVNTPEIYFSDDVDSETRMPMQGAERAAFHDGYRWVKHWSLI